MNISATRIDRVQILISGRGSTFHLFECSRVLLKIKAITPALIKKERLTSSTACSLHDNYFKVSHCELKKVESAAFCSAEFISRTHFWQKFNLLVSVKFNIFFRPRKFWPSEPAQNFLLCPLGAEQLLIKLFSGDINFRKHIFPQSEKVCLIYFDFKMRTY